mmetsp:Transcript_17759/g.26899  ORF Transcript_17759/g.26899 Transcript_17759/m.26899 type:complete len:553 (+) Transcript_17759:51-1709(+)
MGIGTIANNGIYIIGEKLKTRTKLSIPLFVIKATAIASLGGVLFGYDTGIIAGALPQVTQDFTLSSQQQEWSVGILYLGAGLGAAVGGVLCDVFGRKRSIMGTDVVFVVGAVLLASAPNVAQFLVGRVVVGFAVSISAIADVSYLHEIAPRKWRGAIVSVNEACISLGFLVAFAFGVMWNNVNGGWRLMFGVSGLLGLVQYVGMLAMPESPVWLKQKGREEESREALQKIHGEIIPSGETTLSELSDAEENDENKHSSHVKLNEDVQDDELVTPHDAAQQLSSPTQSGDKLNSFFHIVVQYRYQCCIALFISMAQQFCGQAAVLNYAPLIFSDLDDSDFSITLWIGGVKFLTTVAVICSIEYRGRRFLMLFGTFAIVIGQFLVAFAFSIGNAIEGDTTESAMTCGFIGILAVVFGYSVSFGPLSWVIISEMFPSYIRGRALGGSTVVNYVCATLVTSTFLSMEGLIGARNVFFLYGLITLFAMMFVVIAIPETGKKSPKEIDELVRRMWLWNKFQRREVLQVDENDSIELSQTNLPAQGNSRTLQVHDAELA